MSTSPCSPDAIAAILAQVAAAFQVTVADVTGPDRSRAVGRARAAAVAVLYRRCRPLSLQAIGDVLGGRSYTTIIATLRRAEALAQDDPEFAATLQALLHQL